MNKKIRYIIFTPEQYTQRFGESIEGIKRWHEENENDICLACSDEFKNLLETILSGHEKHVTYFEQA